MIAASDIDQDLSGSATHGGFSSHGIRPEPVDLPCLQRACRKYSEGYIAASCAWQFDDFEITARFDTGTNQHLFERLVRPLGRCQPKASDCVEVSSPGGKISPHNQKPRCSLRERDDDFGPFPRGEFRQ